MVMVIMVVVVMVVVMVVVIIVVVVMGVLYDLDKQIKTIERYMRRLEFHISKVDELYEGYCIQRRLQDGASKMKQAFAASPSSRAARESLSEISRSYREYTENMCTIEAELENLLGEFSIKMKGLAGFARLCPGDQYEIFMKYGRQRWKLKGKIEANGKQSWDGEEVVFLPLIVGFISIKVTELKGLATHLLVGSVTCETKELFAARPQVVAVDINDLGTIKLSLEITWYPFDVEDMTASSGAGNKAAALQRRMSMYSQGTPETPTLKDHSFFRWLRPSAAKPRRLSVLSALQDTFFAKLSRSCSFSDLPSLRLRPKAELEFSTQNSCSRTLRIGSPAGLRPAMYLSKTRMNGHVSSKLLPLFPFQTVFRTLVSQILDRAEPLLPSSLPLEVITVFQYYSYFTSHGVSDLESHVNQLAKQVSLIQTLQSLRDEKLLQAMSDLAPSSLPAQQEVLRTLALLLMRNDSQVSQAVMLYLAAASRDEHFREKALLYYCEALTKANLQLQKAACLALKSLQATESIKMLVTLCQSDTEEIRNVASETLLSLGEDGRLAYEQLDKFPHCVHVGGRHGTEVATAF
ncbi:rho family-interacting cell polarization regulator 2 [Leptonychotes weddellii]|uniref:Rho family-interacting cell polarization regulator 2 n=1 Tax=Leptonychotes weddellii TaxID=9713 RepID=A0A7F8RHV8_LEPWE|nr:rho family-interacting cell polarization regulator 2 [Leptonychotes weddellii]